jgi:hypothetical protein
MQRSILTISFLILYQIINAQSFRKYGEGLNIRSFYHQQGINYYLTSSDSNENIYGIYYDTVSSGFNFGNEFTTIRLQIYNGITWLYTKPIKLFSKHTIDAPRILDIEYINGKVWICGSFDSSENNLGAGVILYNGQNWEASQLKLYQTFQDYFEVRQIIHVRNQILLTGNFDSIQGLKSNGIIYYDGNAWGPIGKSTPFGFNGPSNIGNVFFKKTNDSIYAFNKNKISPDSFDISGKTYRKIAVLRNKQFEQINIPFSHIAGINTYKNNLIVLPSSNLIYISSISLFDGNSWSIYPLKDSFYATNYVGGFEQNNLLYLFFQNPSLSQIDVYQFDGNRILKTKSFKIANQYINLEFSDETFLHNFSGQINEIKQGNYSLKTNKIFGIDFKAYTKLYGQTFNDLNNDGIKQINENVLPNCKVYDLSNKYMTLSNSEGQYELLLPVGNSYIFESNNIAAKSGLNYALNNTIDSLYNINIGLNPLNEDDIKIKIIAHTAKKAKQGFITRYEIQVSNNSLAKYKGNLTVTHMSKIKDLKFEDFNALNSNRIRFITSIELEPHQFKKLTFSCIYAVDSFSLNEVVKTTADINVYDAKMSNNFDTINQVVVSAFDPNIKEAFPNELANIEKEINYTIWFQNEGNDTALNVCVVDSFGSLFSLKDIHITGDSKGGTIIPEVRNNCLIWNFKNIMLPPKSIDSDKSIGFVSFRTRLNQQAKIGDTIYNKASIYFDYQKPIVTNNAKVYFSKNINLEDYNFENNISFFPNPNKGKLFFNLGGKQLQSIEIINLQGQIVFTYSYKGDNETIELPETIQDGIYFIKCNGLIQTAPLILLRQ